MDFISTLKLRTAFPRFLLDHWRIGIFKLEKRQFALFNTLKIIFQFGYHTAKFIMNKPLIYWMDVTKRRNE
jgi:hypothetical protein